MRCAFGIAFSLFFFIYDAYGSGYIWGPKIEDIVFKGESRASISIDNSYCGSRSIVRSIVKGSNGIAQYKVDLDIGLDEASLSFSVCFQSDFEFPKKNHKLPLGLWGGEAKADCLSGGCPIQMRNGFSVRLVEELGSPSVYIYSLDNDLVGCKEGKRYGRLYKSDAKISKGKWIEFKIRVRLNQIGSDDGVVELYMNGANILLVNGLEFRRHPTWVIRGPILTDLFGGDINSLNSISPKKQKVGYRSYLLKSD